MVAQSLSGKGRCAILTTKVGKRSAGVNEWQCHVIEGFCIILIWTCGAWLGMIFERVLDIIEDLSEHSSLLLINIVYPLIFTSRVCVFEVKFWDFWTLYWRVRLGDLRVGLWLELDNLG